MELFPIIYTSLLIAAALFFVTVIISYITYKVKQSKDEEEIKINSISSLGRVKITEAQPKIQKEHLQTESSHKDKKEIKADSSNGKEFKKSTSRKYEKQEDEEKSSRQKSLGTPVNSKKISNNRIEIVGDLKSGKEKLEERQYKKSSKQNNADAEKKKTSNIESDKNRKKLKSIDDDPLNKYSDSLDDDLHPLRTDD